MDSPLRDMETDTEALYTKDSEYECPLCLGFGKIVGHRQWPPVIRAEARKLYREGKSLREIAKELKLDVGPQVIKSMIMAKTL